MGTSVVVVGAGCTGSVLGRSLAEAGHDVTIIEARCHVGGNCHTEEDRETGILVHRHGPHIFHTDDTQVWEYVNRFAEFYPYINRVKIVTEGRVYSLPINLLTINQFFGKAMHPDEARRYMESLTDSSTTAPVSFEEQALCSVGRRLYDRFFRGYTEKQWGRAPAMLPASLLKRLPVRFDYNDNYFSDRYQGIPVQGYTAMIAQILDHPGISVQLGQHFDADEGRRFDHVFYSGPIDAYFNHSLGHLEYRTLDFERFTYSGDYQGCAVMNYGDRSVPYTRVAEHKHFSPWMACTRSVCFREYSRRCEPNDAPYYPVHLTGTNALFLGYAALARRTPRLTLVGRLGTYRYLNMDTAVREALDTAALYQWCLTKGHAMPTFAFPSQDPRMQEALENSEPSKSLRNELPSWPHRSRTARAHPALAAPPSCSGRPGTLRLPPRT